MEINFWAVVVCAVLSMVIGSLWYGKFLFGKVWMEISGIDITKISPEKVKEMQRQMFPLYLIQFLLSVLTLVIFAKYIHTMDNISGLSHGLLVFSGFVMPVIAGQIMWSGKPRNIAWKAFWVSSGYNFVLFLVYGFILSSWK